MLTHYTVNKSQAHKHHIIHSLICITAKEIIKKLQFLFFKLWAKLSIFLFTFVLFSIKSLKKTQFDNIKTYTCAWDSNPVLQDSRRRLIANIFVNKFNNDFENYIKHFYRLIHFLFTSTWLGFETFPIKGLCVLRDIYSVVLT